MPPLARRISTEQIEQLCKEYADNKISVKEIQRIHRIGHEKLTEIIEQKGLSTRGYAPGPEKRVKKTDPKTKLAIIKDHFDNGLSIYHCGAKHGFSRTAIKLILIESGRPMIKRNNESYWNPNSCLRRKIWRLWFEHHMTINGIAMLLFKSRRLTRRLTEIVRNSCQFKKVDFDFLCKRNRAYSLTEESRAFMRKFQNKKKMFITDYIMELTPRQVFENYKNTVIALRKDTGLIYPYARFNVKVPTGSQDERPWR